MPDEPRELTITRVFAAPRAAVWNAWTDPDELAKWWGPKGVTTPRDSIKSEVRPGGPFRLTMVADADGAKFHANGTYREVTEPDALVVVEPPNASDDDAIQVARVTFSDVGETHTQVGLTTKVRLPENLLAGARNGWASAFEKLDGLLAKREQPADGPSSG